MTLSIITINFNNVLGLKRTMRSVLEQNWKNYEWILIDGGSLDGSRQLIEQTYCVLQEDGDRNPITYYCSEQDSGIYNAMNKGLRHASGDYVMFLNSGDVFAANNVLSQVFFKTQCADVIYGDLCFVGKRKSKVFHYPSQLTFHYFFNRSLGHPASFIRRTLLEETGYREDFRIVSDWYAFLHWFQQGRTFQHVDVVVANFDAGGISLTDDARHTEERERVFAELFRPEDRKWIEESIRMQQMYEENVRYLDKMSGKEKVRGLRLVFLKLVSGLIRKI